MQLSKIRIRNYRLITDGELDIDPRSTLIVGRNNTAKTSCFQCIGNVLSGKLFTFHDYPLLKRQNLYSQIALFMEKRISFDELCGKIDTISIDFLVDYSVDGPDDNLGMLSPFIIDVDMDITTALIRVEYQLKADEKALWQALESSYYRDGAFVCDQESCKAIGDNFNKIFGQNIYAINPKDVENKQIKTLKELQDLFPLHIIPAERVLGEDDTHNSSLGSLISSFFDDDEADLEPELANEALKLREIVDRANRDIQRRSDEVLSSLVNNAVGFGYPNIEELTLGVTTQLSIDEQIKSQTSLTYISEKSNESLPNTYNGLGYKNLIKIEFLLAAFANKVEKSGNACIPLLFIEEPESHMHPQMQTAFTKYLEDFMDKISSVRIQILLSSHSAHIANTMEFAKIRYAQKSNKGVVFKNLDSFAQTNPENLDFIRKYLTLTKCDLFFADKAILVEGAAERLLLPDMIGKCEKKGEFGSCKYPLSAQYYTIIEVGGAYAHKFIPFIDFLNLPSLVLTDLDSVAGVHGKSVPVSQGDTTSNETIRWWIRNNKDNPERSKTKIPLNDIMTLSSEEKTRGKCHIEFQTMENGICAHSLEEAIRNVNRTYYGLSENISEEELEFSGRRKTDFALDLIYEYEDYTIPEYIRNGLIWLNKQKVLE